MGLGILSALKAVTSLFTSGASALSVGLKSPKGRKIIGGTFAILLLLFGTYLILGIFRDRAAIKADRDKILAAYENKDKEYVRLKTEFKKLKRRTFTVERRLPTGEVIITTSIYEDSEQGSTEKDTGTEHTVFPPKIGGIQSRLPVSALGIISLSSWSVGAGYEMVTIKIPFTSIRIHGIPGLTVGQKWADKKPIVSGVVVFQISRKAKVPIPEAGGTI